jgi:hypothetical protein
MKAERLAAEAYIDKQLATMGLTVVGDNTIKERDREKLIVDTLSNTTRHFSLKTQHGAK